MATAFSVNVDNWQQDAKLSELVLAISERNEAIGGSPIAYEGDGSWSTSAYSAVSAGDNVQHYNFFNYIDAWISANYDKFLDPSSNFDGATDIAVYASMDALASAAGLTDEASLTDFPLAAVDYISAAWFSERTALLSAMRAVLMYKDSEGAAITVVADESISRDVDTAVYDYSTIVSNHNADAGTVTSELPRLQFLLVELHYYRIVSVTCKLEFYVPSAITSLVHEAVIFAKTTDPALLETYAPALYRPHWSSPIPIEGKDVYKLITTIETPVGGSEETGRLFGDWNFPAGRPYVDTNTMGFSLAATDPFKGVIKLDLTNGTPWT